MGPKSRRAHPFATPNHDSAPDLSRAVRVAFTQNRPEPTVRMANTVGKATSTARLKPGAIHPKQIAAPSTRRVFTPPVLGPTNPGLLLGAHRSRPLQPLAPKKPSARKLQTGPAQDLLGV